MNSLLAAAGFAVALGFAAAPAQAQTPPTSNMQATPAMGTQTGPGKRCDSDGCWTYDCDATSNHCHRHWVSSTPRGIPMMGAAPPRHRADQICDMNGENCTDVTNPGG